MHSFIKAAESVASQFEYTDQELRNAKDHFVEQLVRGLECGNTHTVQIPSYISSLPDGSETGSYLAADLGGTNFRISLVEFHGQSKYAIKQSKIAIPAELMVSSKCNALFGFMAGQIQDFLALNDSPSARPRPLAFTFSFAIEQTSINSGKLLNWDKGFDMPDAIGLDPCLLLQEQLDIIGVPVQIAALANDTIGTLLAQHYLVGGGAMLGAVFGTGTNGAYLEKTSNIHKIIDSDNLLKSGCGDFMVVNTEWGGLDDDTKQLKLTQFDIAIDQASLHPGRQRYEKLVSGMYLGEIFRRAVLSARSQSGFYSSFDPSKRPSPLFRPWQIHSSLLTLLADKTLQANVKVSKNAVEDMLGCGISGDEMLGLQLIANAIGRRAARLAGVAIAAAIIKTGRLEKTALQLTSSILKRGSMVRHGCLATEEQFTSNVSRKTSVGLDGSLAELYPGFVEGIRSTLRLMPEIGVLEASISIDIVKDGSSLGSALIACAAENQAKRRRQEGPATKLNF